MSSTPIPREHEMQLPFTHGIEVELQVIKRDGSWIKGEEILQIFDRIVSNAKGLLDKRIRTSTVESVRVKYRQSSQTEEGERGSRVVVSYQNPQGVFQEYTLVSHDPNVTSLTWILEVVTPPCTTLEELAWWTQTLIAISYESLPSESQAVLVSTGLNPTQEYLRSLSFGEHHHILGPTVSQQVRIGVYNMIRNFLPHFIALSVNSPFENKAPTDLVSLDEHGRTRAPKCKRSIRLSRNTTQLGPTNEFEFIPYITNADKDAFARHVNRSYARMVDVYPFTRFDTVEVRVFDTQLSIPRRIGLALIMQALCLKAKKMVERGEVIPDVGAKSLAANRQSAVNAGLWAPFHPASAGGSSEFVRIYNTSIGENGEILDGRRNRFMGDAVESMFFFIRDEIEELRLIDNPFLQPLLVSIFGSESWERRTTGADYQLDVFAKSDQNMVVLLRKLADTTRECCTNWLYDPLDGAAHVPTWLRWWTGIEPEIIIGPDKVFAGQETDFTISARNTSERAFTNLNLVYSVEDSARHVLQQNVIPITKLDPGEIHISRVTLLTKLGVTAYNVILKVQIAGREISISSTINTHWIRLSVRPGSTTQFADGKTPVLFGGEIETNYPRTLNASCTISVLAPAKEKAVIQVSKDVRLETGGVVLLDHAGFPPLIIPPTMSDGVERCMLKMSLTDEEGREYSSVLSRPFYVGFRTRGPQLEVTANTRPIHTPGDIVTIGLRLNARGQRLSPSARVVLEFKSEAGTTLRISETPTSGLAESGRTIEWEVPSFPTLEPSEQTGSITASLFDGATRLTSAETPRFRIATSGFEMQIDSIRAPDRASVGGKISGWMRIRRSQEEGDPAELHLTLRYAENDEHVVMKQQLRPVRNLSLAYGPLVVPDAQSTTSPGWVDLVADIVCGGVTLDRRVVRIQLTRGEESGLVKMAFTGLPVYVEPDENLRAVLSIAGAAAVPVEARLRVTMESAVGNETLLEQDVRIEEEQKKLIPVAVRVPIGAEMSTAHLVASLEAEGKSLETRHRLKIKAIERPLCEIGFTVRDERGEEISGLVPRASQVALGVRVKLPRAYMNDMEIRVRVMSRRDTVDEFDARLEPSESLEHSIDLRWLTPKVDAVTAYYLDASILHRGRPLPKRAVSQTEKQVTVY